MMEGESTGCALTLRWLPGRYAICRLARDRSIPAWALKAGGFVSVTRIDSELSIIVNEEDVPEDEDGLVVETGWAALRIVGTLSFELVGILARLTGALADAGIPVCAVSTYETDVLLVRSADVERAADALKSVAQFEPSGIDSGKEQAV